MASPREPAASVIVVSHNSAAELPACLRSALAAGVPEVILVDNASLDGTPDLVRRDFPSVRVVANADNAGFGVASNQGVALAEHEYVLLLNPDAVLHPGALGELITTLRSRLTLGLVGPRLLNPNGSVQRSAFRFPTPGVLLLEQLNLGHLLGSATSSGLTSDSDTCAADWIKGAALLARRSILRAFGPFDPMFSMFGEDIDLCFRLRAAGFEVRLTPHALVTHLGGRSTRLYPDDMILQFFVSMYAFYRKHYSVSAHRQATLVVRTVAGLKALKALAGLAGAAASGRPDQCARLRRELRLWRRVAALRLQPTEAAPMCATI